MATPDISYNERLEEFHAQLRNKEAERDAEIARFDREIAALRKIVETLASLTGKSPIKSRDLDDLILNIFKEDPTARLSRKRILKRLLDSGADLSDFSNRMSYVHASVGRLHKKEILSRVWEPISGSTKKRAFYFLKKMEEGS